MKIRRKTNIEIRREKIRFVRRAARELFCAECGGQMSTIDEAAQSSDFSSRAIFRMVETGKLHFRETPDRLLLVCRESLLQNRKTIKGEIEK